MRWTSAWILLFVVGCKAAGGVPARGEGHREGYRPSTEAIAGHIAFLASDFLEGRDSGTPGGLASEEYLLAEFRAAGLAGVEGQRFEFNAGARLGPASALAIAGGPLPEASFRPYAFSAPGEGGWPAVFAGHGITAADLGRDDYAGLEARGKVVVVLDGAPGGEGPHGKFAAYQSPRAKALRAREVEAAALLVLVDRLPAFEGEDSARDVGIPVLAVLRAAAAGPLGLPGAGDAPPGAPPPGETAPRLLGAPVRLRADVSSVERSARNVLGWLSGSRGGTQAGEHVAEYVIVGAHLDGLGRGHAGSMRPERRGEIHNGADDNASGAAALVELARSLRSRAGELGRPVLFAAFAAEERGLLGSRWLADHLPLPPGSSPGAAPRPVAMVNMDMVGRLQKKRLLVSGVSTSPDWPGILEAAAARVERAGERALEVESDRSEDLFGSSDHQSFYTVGVPVLLFFTGAHPQYHTPDDDLELTNPAGTSRVARLVEELLLEISRAPSPPRYRPGVDLAPRMSFKALLRLMPDYAAGVEGMRIASVTPGGPAAEAGLLAGDVLVRLGAVPVRSVKDYMVGLEQARPGQAVEVEYLRGGERHRTRVVPVAAGR